MRYDLYYDYKLQYSRIYLPNVSFSLFGDGENLIASKFFSRHWFQYLRAIGFDAFWTASGLGVSTATGVVDLALGGAVLRK